MIYLTGFETENDVVTRSQQEAWLRGCQNYPNDITSYWQSWISHPVQVEFALCFPDDESKLLLTQQELDSLKTQLQMETDDWFLEI